MHTIKEKVWWNTKKGIRTNFHFTGHWTGMYFSSCQANMVGFICPTCVLESEKTTTTTTQCSIFLRKKKEHHPVTLIGHHPFCNLLQGRLGMLTGSSRFMSMPIKSKQANKQETSATQIWTSQKVFYWLSPDDFPTLGVKCWSSGLKFLIAWASGQAGGRGLIPLHIPVSQMTHKDK